MTWEFTETRQIVDRFAGRPVNAIIESVRDGSTVRAFLLPDFYHITLMMSGIRVRFPQCRNFGYFLSLGSSRFNSYVQKLQFVSFSGISILRNCAVFEG